MKIAILADIHSNVEALEAVLLAAEKGGAERFFCLGDVVGYGVDPVACIYRLREVEAVCVLGNHDQAMVNTRCVRTLNTLARHTILQSRAWLSDEEIQYLHSFAFRRIEFDGVFSHANPIRPEEWGHLYLYEKIVWCMERLDWLIGFCGHTHYPGIFCRMNEQTIPLTSTKVAIGRHRYLVNPGSVGQPRDGDWRAAFAMWDIDCQLVELHRVEYPVKQTQEKIYQMGWPYYVADRLSRGE